MLKIYVCEDNEIQRNKYVKFIQNTILIEEIDAELCLATQNPYILLNNIKDSNNIGLYFLDINLNSDLNGIKLAVKIREYDPRGFIVFVTSHLELIYLTFVYKVEAMDYIIKDNYNDISNRIKLCIMNANKRYLCGFGNAKKVLNIKSEDKVISFEFDKILFFETSSTIHKVVIHATDRQIEFYSQMKDIESKLDERFFRCHRSYIVNKNNIKEIDKKNKVIRMINEEECEASTRGIKKLI